MVNEDNVDAATKLDGNEAPASTREQYRRIAAANSADWNWRWRDEERATVKDNHNIVDAVAGQLELTDFQSGRAHHYIDKLPRRFYRAYASHLLALCVCGLSGRKDGRHYHPNLLRPTTKENEFSDLAESIGARYRPLYKCWGAVNREIQR